MGGVWLRNGEKKETARPKELLAAVQLLTEVMSSKTRKNEVAANRGRWRLRGVSGERLVRERGRRNKRKRERSEKRK